MDTTEPDQPQPPSALDQISACASAITDLSCSRNLADTEQEFKQEFEKLRELRDEAQFRNENERHLAFVRYHDCIGRYWGLRAVHAFTAEVDPTNSNTFSLRAIDQHEQALEHARAIDLGDSPEQKAGKESFLALHRANLDDARGMMRLSAGEIQFKSAQFERAKESLSEACEELDRAEQFYAADARANAVQPDPGFSDVARALLAETSSEMALIRGALADAAESEASRAAALESAARKHAISDLKTSRYFARRLKHDAEFAHARAQLFRDAAAHHKKPPWFASYLFLVFAIGSAVTLVFVMGYLELIDSPFVIGLIFVFVFAVAGVATRLAKWSEGAELLASLTKSAGSKSDS